jgi:alpha-L-fucosidase
MTLPDWFERARFGLFFHWGHSSQQGVELSWPMVGGSPVLPRCQSMTVDEYQSSAATFEPTAFDAREWARLAKDCGAEYAVLTSKHHDGYAMFHTARSAFSIEHSPFRRDIVRDFTDAFREAGLRVGLYFSLLDWHHPDYPPWRDDCRPYLPGRWPQPTPEQWERYIEFTFAQVRELLTNYGRIDIIWFDGQWERTPDQWRAKELEAMIRELQPDIVINDRLPGCGDYDTPEQFVPATPPERPWEVCLTINESWGYNPSDVGYKSAREIVHTLCEIAARGGRLLLNLSPRGDGILPPEQVERLEAVGGWLQRNGEAIFNTEPALEPWQFYGPTTRSGNTVYLHLLMRPYETVTVRGVPIRRVSAVHELSTGCDLAFTTRCAILDQLLNADPLGELTIEAPEEGLDPLATVIAVDIRPKA